MNELDIALCPADEITLLLHTPGEGPTVELLQKIQRIRPDLKVHTSLSREGWLLCWYIVERSDNE